MTDVEVCSVYFKVPCIVVAVIFSLCIGKSTEAQITATDRQHYCSYLEKVNPQKDQQRNIKVSDYLISITQCLKVAFQLPEVKFVRK